MLYRKLEYGVGCEDFVADGEGGFEKRRVCIKNLYEIW